MFEQESDQKLHKNKKSDVHDIDKSFKQNHETIQELQNEEELDDIEQYINKSPSEKVSSNNNEFISQNNFENHDNITNNESGFQKDGDFFESQPVDKENSHEIMEESINSDTEDQQKTNVEEIDEQGFFQEEEIKEDIESEKENAENLSSASRPNSNPLDVTEFANSELSNMDDGEYLYDLTISHMDSKDLREAFKEILMDKKLKINHNDFLKKIKNGQVCIPKSQPC